MLNIKYPILNCSILKNFSYYIKWQIEIKFNFYFLWWTAQLDGAVEYTDCISDDF